MKLLLLLAGHACAEEALGCETDEDCSLLGVCTSGACYCDPGWHGADCGPQLECLLTFSFSDTHT